MIAATQALVLGWLDLVRPRIFGVLAAGVALTLGLFIALQAAAFWALRAWGPEAITLPWVLRQGRAADHPTPKPLDAFGIPMRQHVARGGLCYEPFCGSGSQIIAGEANSRRVFAMEISPAYVDVAVERWQAETGRDAILDADGRTFASVKAERLGDKADAPATDTALEPARKRKPAA